ncbi:MAG: hypothetical protein B9S34_06300 [Opitutia bacterium Tous-C1TDCM]|nr:MAG: hypothetical protein B9S34_06300 [Opitutae bacterium Tous-C1TDCM]
MRFRRAFPVVRSVFGLLAALFAPTLAAAPQLELPPALESSRLITNEELLASAQKLLPRGAFLGPLLDARYAVIKHDWLVKRFIPSYRRAVASLQAELKHAGDESADCDDFGMFLRHMAALSGMLAGGAQPSAAQVIVFQENSFSGVGRTRERHAVGLFLTERGWQVLEPQNADKLVPLESYVNRTGIQYISFH